jgi:hypothetical protein
LKTLSQKHQKHQKHKGKRELSFPEDSVTEYPFIYSEKLLLVNLLISFYKRGCIGKKRKTI